MTRVIEGLFSQQDHSFPRRFAPFVALVATLTVCGCSSSRELYALDLGSTHRPDLRAPAPPHPAIAHEVCAPLATPTTKLRRIQLAGAWLEPQGYALRAADSADKWVPKRLVLGVLADPRGALPGTLRNIDLLAARFTSAKVHAVLLLGGIARAADDQRRIVQRLVAALSVPVLVLLGDRAGLQQLRGTLADLGRRVVDLTLVRTLRHPAATLLSLPGHPLPAQLLSGPKGCAYSSADLDSLATLSAKMRRPRLLLAYAPPRGAGPQAVDRSLANVNCGSEALRELMERGDIRFGLFAHISEAGGQATTRAGSPLAEHTWGTSMLLNVGSVDAIPRRDLEGRWRHGMGVIVELRGEMARYRRIELPPVSAALLERQPRQRQPYESNAHRPPTVCPGDPTAL
ncbi:MAG: hypothetical protein JRH20_11415 [Deltaproteobacteria bacterium]|nr:hypothetical protein [Deltaproteobacteria bacterium]